MTNEKIKEILDRCNGRFGWVQIHIDTAENYLLMPLADMVDLLEKQLPKKPVDNPENGWFECPNCGLIVWVYYGTGEKHHCECGQALDYDWEVIE